MKIAIVLPAPSTKAIGGYKIMYEYAKYLNTDYNYSIDIYYDINSSLKMRYIKKVIRYLSINRNNFFKWFNFEASNLNHIVDFNLNVETLKKYNAVIATSAPVAKKIQLSNMQVPVIYFIQHYEDWSLPEKELIATYKAANVHNIVISTWLQNILISNEAKVEKLLPNPIDHEKFHMTFKPEDRKVASLSMMYHIVKWKGSKEGLTALEIVKKQIPEFEVTLFSVYEKPTFIPDWIEYVYQPSQTRLLEIYNKNALFLSPSIKEGYGLPPAEAMACGAMVITTDSGGVSTFCKNNKTAIVVKSPPNPQEIANKILDLINANDIRIRLAYAGNTFIKNFTWDDNVRELDKLMKEIHNEL